MKAYLTHDFLCVTLIPWNSVKPSILWLSSVSFGIWALLMFKVWIVQTTEWWLFSIMLSDQLKHIWNSQWFFIKNGLTFLVIIIPPTQRSCWGVYWFHSVRPSVRLSVRPSRIPRPLCSAYSSGWIHFIFIHLIKQLQKVCRVSYQISKFEFLSFFF